MSCASDYEYDSDYDDGYDDDYGMEEMTLENEPLEDVHTVEEVHTVDSYRRLLAVLSNLMNSLSPEQWQDDTFTHKCLVMPALHCVPACPHSPATDSTPASVLLTLMQMRCKLREKPDVRQTDDALCHVITQLLASGRFAQDVDSLGRPPVVAACQHGMPETVLRALLAGGCDVNAVDSRGCTALICECSSRPPRSDIVWQLLYCNAHVNHQDHEGRTALFLLVEQLSYGGLEQDVFDPLLRWFVNAHADPNIMDGQGDTALCEAVKHENAAVVKELLRSGANANQPNGSGATPLHIALHYNESWPEASLTIIDMLLKAGADPNQTHGSGATPLHIALHYSESWPEASQIIIGMLLEAGADPNLSGHDGRSPLHVAIDMDAPSSVVGSLLKAGADPNARHPDGTMPIVKTLDVRYSNSSKMDIIFGLVHAGANLARCPAGQPLHIVRAILDIIRTRDKQQLFGSFVQALKDDYLLFLLYVGVAQGGLDILAAQQVLDEFWRKRNRAEVSWAPNQTPSRSGCNVAWIVVNIVSGVPGVDWHERVCPETLNYIVKCAGKYQLGNILLKALDAAPTGQQYLEGLAKEYNTTYEEFLHHFGARQDQGERQDLDEVAHELGRQVEKRAHALAALTLMPTIDMCMVNTLLVKRLCPRSAIVALLESYLAIVARLVSVGIIPPRGFLTFVMQNSPYRLLWPVLYFMERLCDIIPDEAMMPSFRRGDLPLDKWSAVQSAINNSSFSGSEVLLRATVNRGPWSMQTHKRYPEAFKVVVRNTLLLLHALGKRQDILVAQQNDIKLKIIELIAQGLFEFVG